MRYLVILIVLGLSMGFSFGQAHKIDRLELYYSQGHYKKVFKESGKLLDKPEYDYTKIPAFYRAMSIFQLTENRQWAKARPNALKEAKELYLSLMATQDGLDLIEDHLTIVSALKQDLSNRVGNLQLEGKNKESEQIQEVLAQLFESVPVLNDEFKVVDKPETKEEIADVKTFTFDAKNRDELVAYAKLQLGKPYRSAGNTPEGFDCSGFTSYVFNAYKIQLPRRSSEQFDQAKKIRENKVQKGDLVFFDNGSGVNHVGIIVSEQGESPVMIHASTSKGIILTEINSSEYWVKRLKGYGSFIE
ncbi:MAG TPA: C40 family peptidase [Taishania sp.]|nr:C40 family peptidase [Taishania sp.]